MFFYSKEMAVFLNSSHNINYAAIFIFFRVMVLFNIIPDSLLGYLHFFYNKRYCFLLSYKIIKIGLKFCEIKNNNLILLIFKTVYSRGFRFIQLIYLFKMFIRPLSFLIIYLIINLYYFKNLNHLIYLLFNIFIIVNVSRFL